VNEVELALATSDLDPSLLCLELTEGSLLDPDDEAGRRLSRFTDLGVKIAIDDFGTGYSSMSYLKRLPVHRIKVDRSFVIGLPDNREDVSITEAILTMADGLGLSVTAEGVDNAEQVAFLRKHGCGCFQGYYFARPMSGDDFAAFLEHAASGAVL
jgi:EAL domain-containing protein (putative c-di-GMP-specific phosphodiesterase class I)